jgi:GTPase
MKTFKVAIIGRPNVGKSSLFNRVVGRRQVIVHGRAGTTRDAITEPVGYMDKAFELTDTAGFLREKNNFLIDEALKKVEEEIKKADLLLLVVDGNISPTNEDQQIVNIARKSGKEVFLVINKVDNQKERNAVEEYKRLGFKNIYLTSAIHNIGVSDLKDAIAEKSPKSKTLSTGTTRKVRIVLTGRPNVGKSSILNAMAKKEKAIVSDIPGTTRDVVTETIIMPSLNHGGDDLTEELEEGEDRPFASDPQTKSTETLSAKISDTAGARKPGKIGKAFKKGEPIERFSFLRTQKEIERADIVLVVIDASDKIAAQDLHIAGAAKEIGKGIILVVNKWDLTSDLEQDKFLRRLQRRFNFMIWVPAIFVSAKTGRNIEEIPQVIRTVWENQNKKVPTSRLNRILEDYNLINPPAGLKGLKPKTYFASQTDVVPPTFVITAKHHDFVHFSYKRGIENELRRHFDFAGTPLKIEFRRKNN